MADQLLTVHEAAEYLRCHKDTVRRWCKSGELPARCLPGGDYRINEADLDAFLKPVGQTEAAN